ncbi:lysophospholipid acyltransferase family protein [Aquirufa sp. ROCK2-A2]
MKKQVSWLTKSFTFLYTIWAAFWFISFFLLLYPVIFVLIHRKSWKRYALQLIHIWGQLFFLFSFIRFDITYHFKPKKDQIYVFCANHFSYLDIPVLVVLIKNHFSFIGKSSIKKVPLFGYMYAKLHVLVDRGSKSSRASSLILSVRALQNRSLAIFPEGGITSKKFPFMSTPLKDGAFQMAIQQKVPIVPISLFNNHLLLNDDNFLLRPGVIKVHVHEPLVTTGLTMEDLPIVREKIYQAIQKPILAHYSLDLPN